LNSASPVIWRSGRTSTPGFSPLITHSSPSLTAWVVNRLGSDPPWGSVIEYADHSSWLSIGVSQRSFWSSVP